MVPRSEFEVKNRWLVILLSLALIAVSVVVYFPGLSGGFMFDDYPNIVDNPAVQPTDASISSLTKAALSSPSSDLKRPLSSLSFAANVLVSGLSARAMKMTNLGIHIVNGLLLFALLSRLLPCVERFRSSAAILIASAVMSVAWLMLPINLTPVLYVVQRMESLANAFVLTGLLGYISVRRRGRVDWRSKVVAIAWIVLPTAFGLMAKETAVLLPLYALSIEAIVFRFRNSDGTRSTCLLVTYVALLLPPLALGTIWLGPGILDSATWATRDFTLATRLLSEPRVLIDYLQWTAAPGPGDLSFYHDDFVQSTNWLHPETTIPSILALGLLCWSAWRARTNNPLFSLGVALFFGCHLLTATVLPLELVYEHRNYFASIGVIMTIASLFLHSYRRAESSKPNLRYAIIAAPALMIGWSACLTFYTTEAWSTPLSVAQELARRGPDSPRAQYELGRAYIIDSRYRPDSPSTPLVYAPLEKAAILPGSSILPEQALIFFNSRLNRPISPDWWTTLKSKLRTRPATIQDESSLDALATCLRQDLCSFSAGELSEAFRLAHSHERRSARLCAMYANFAWHTLRDNSLSLQLQRETVLRSPREGVYRITLIRMLEQQGDHQDAKFHLSALRELNIGGRYDTDIATLQATVMQHNESDRTGTGH